MNNSPWYRLFIGLNAWWEVNEETGEEVLICDTDQQAIKAYQDLLGEPAPLSELPDVSLSPWS